MSGKKEQFQPRKCAASNRLINTKDHASVTLPIAQLNEDGVFTGVVTTYSLSGFVRKNGDADQAVNRLAAKDGLMKDLSEFPTSE